MDPVETVTVLFTDLVGSTEMTLRIGPTASEEIRLEHFGILREAIAEAGGEEIKNLGDGLMIVYRSASDAIDGSVAMQRTGAYAVDYTLLPLEAVAGKTRTMEDEFISAGGNDVTEAFLRYLRPLVGSGMPDAHRLRGVPVAKRRAD